MTQPQTRNPKPSFPTREVLVENPEGEGQVGFRDEGLGFRILDGVLEVEQSSVRFGKDL